jgi:hypothetical protein
MQLKSKCASPSPFKQCRAIPYNNWFVIIQQILTDIFQKQILEENLEDIFQKREMQDIFQSFAG